MVWSYPLDMMALGPPKRYRPRSMAACALPRATQHERQSNLQMAATCAGLEGAHQRPSCETNLGLLVRGLGILSKRYRECQDWISLIWEVLKKIWSMSQDRPFIWKSYWQQFGWSLKLVGHGLRESQGHHNVSQVYGDPVRHPPADSVGKGSEKEHWLLVALLSGRKLLPSSSCPQPDTPVPSLMSLMPFELLP